MFSHGVGDVSHRPRRAKSASSVKNRAAKSPQSSFLISEVAHKDALTAANVAYGVAGQHDGVNGGSATVENETEKASSKNTKSGPELGRRQSVRFVGPNAVPLRRHSITRREVPGFRSSQESHRHSLSAQPSLLTSHSTGISLRHSPEEFNESYVASEPSSYRKLRKAKSMFSAGKAPSLFASEASMSKQHLHHHSLQSSHHSSEPITMPEPRLKRSYSFLRGVTDRISTGDRQYDARDAAIQLARDTYFHQLEQQRLKEQPSFFGLGKREKIPKAFRRTVRTSSTNSYGTAVSSPLTSLGPPKSNGLGSKARILSQSWKEKLKRVLKRSSNGQGTLPKQHLDATQLHYGNSLSNSQRSSQNLAMIPEPNTELLHRVNSRESSLYNEPIFLSKSSRPGSIRSVDSVNEEIHDKSRVTSWTNSTAANTISIPSFAEGKRLSIIKEDGGPHQSSSSAQHDEIEGSRYANFRQPIKQGAAGRLETRRIFSALQRQIDESHRRTALEEGDEGKDIPFDKQWPLEPGAIPRRRSSSRRNIEPPVNAPGFDGNWDGRHVSSGATSDSLSQTLVNNSAYQSGNEDTGNKYKKDCAPSSDDLTPQQAAQMNESSPSSSKRPFREVRSTFFPQSIHIERSNASPYRRAMRAKYEGIEASTLPLENDDQIRIQNRSLIDNVPESPSVYSQFSGGHHLPPTGSYVSLTRSEDNGGHGTAVVIDAREEAHDSLARPFFPSRHSSVNSDKGWQRLMASQVASLENEERSHKVLTNVISTKDSRHKRENAQLDGDDIHIGFLQNPKGVPEQPLRVLQGNAVIDPSSILRCTSSMSKSSPAQATANKKNENSPIQSLTNSPEEYVGLKKENASFALWRDRPSSAGQKFSEASLRSQKDHKESPPTKIQRHSPDRAERLRRLKSISINTLQPAPSQKEFRESQDRLGSLEGQSYNFGVLRENTRIEPTQAGMNIKLVNTFLQDRRKEMRISEESGTDPAFL